uniref:Uncharacterized protein n=1 Tax=Anopheles atroparvus TaxID=41427 RepID=A0AAG5DBP1_ANOAO
MAAPSFPMTPIRQLRSFRRLRRSAASCTTFWTSEPFGVGPCSGWASVTSTARSWPALARNACSFH